MMGSTRWVVVDAYSDGSGVAAIYGPFASQEEARNWVGLPTGPEGGYTVHPLYEPPEWSED